jgi:hypothetical protein
LVVLQEVEDGGVSEEDGVGCVDLVAVGAEESIVALVDGVEGGVEIE